MPKVLHKLRIDEISCVDRAAGEGTRVVLFKRDAPRSKAFGYAMPQPEPSFYAKLFSARPQFAKAMYRNATVTGRHLHRVANLTREEAKHFLLHDAHGRTLLRDTGGDIDVLADHLVEASQRPTEKRKDTNMQNMDKTLRAVGEAGFTKMVEKYAKTVHPTLTKEQAFCKVFLADDDEGAAIRRAWQIAKQVPLDDDEAAEEAEDVEGDALEELEELATAERRRCPTLTKAQAFTKVYVDPANAKLAQRERRQHRPR
jgi:hypothetical protein